MNSILATAAVSLMIGGVVGGGLTRLMVSTQTQVTCLAPAEQPDTGLQTLLTPTPIPLTGYKSW